MHTLIHTCTTYILKVSRSPRAHTHTCTFVRNKFVNVRILVWCCTVRCVCVRLFAFFKISRRRSNQMGNNKMNGNLRQRRRRWQLLRVTSMRFECADVVLTTVRLVTTFICTWHSILFSSLLYSLHLQPSSTLLPQPQPLPPPPSLVFQCISLFSI